MQQWLINEGEYFASVSSLIGNADLLPHVKRSSKLGAGTDAPGIQNHISLGDNATVYLAQGESATQHNVSGGDAPANRDST